MTDLLFVKVAFLVGEYLLHELQGAGFLSWKVDLLKKNEGELLNDQQIRPNLINVVIKASLTTASLRYRYRSFFDLKRLSNASIWLSLIGSC